MSPHSFDYLKLPRLDVSRSHKDVKAPRYSDQDLEWLSGLWLLRGGYTDRGIYFSIPKKYPDTVDRVTEMAVGAFNLHVKLIDHSKLRYRVHFNSLAIKNWWMLIQEILEPTKSMAIGILEAGSWSKLNHEVVTCRKGKVDKILACLSLIHQDIEVKCRENKNSCDIYLININGQAAGES